MVFLVKLAGIAVCSVGVICFLKDALLTKALKFWQGKDKLRLLGLVRIVVGTLLIAASQGCQVPLVILLIGITAVVVGVLTIVRGVASAETVLSWWNKRDMQTRRLVAIFIFLIGALIIFAA
ncbi:MAG: hypothetical protein PHS37_04465 [Candidatus Omnitrophica bacterium]|nr:hypothetical protein [Candidatus Omnitrophota bacterium]